MERYLFRVLEAMISNGAEAKRKCPERQLEQLISIMIWPCHSPAQKPWMAPLLDRVQILLNQHGHISPHTQVMPTAPSPTSQGLHFSKCGLQTTCKKINGLCLLKMQISPLALRATEIKFLIKFLSVETSGLCLSKLVPLAILTSTKGQGMPVQPHSASSLFLELSMHFISQFLCLILLFLSTNLLREVAFIEFLL